MEKNEQYRDLWGKRQRQTNKEGWNKKSTFTLFANLHFSLIYAFGPISQSSPITTPDFIVVFGCITVSAPIFTSS